MNTYFKTIFSRVEQKERKLTFSLESIVEDSLQMITFFNDILKELKEYVTSHHFVCQKEEIFFFREVKPYIQGKELFYYQIYQMETIAAYLPESHLKKYFVKQENKLEKEFKKRFQKQPFYNYYLSGSRHWDSKYFTRYQCDIIDIQQEYMLNFDPDFSTYYDFLVAQILCHKQLMEYFFHRTIELENNIITKDISLEWTATKNDLIELIYALQQVKAIAGGKMSINKMIATFNKIFKLDLKDSHHAFHRMKTRSKSRTSFLDELKRSLEEYMDKE
ncbi:RteC domain-containing protein [Capnocytophaga felis]|uniref:Tetracycline resistance element mobilization regulatory protein RteC n=1 Tax=Capnocytophaga felis TaxID=2267611 RepID=A0A5M4BBJ1_9FLAO|nr:RteC domain-containing protein [Capnocytophaga felis]GET46625.1 hypothetical protein RCZ01_19270 [Capnocytophaga felis]GET48727.1 hypothetical protein RCZ02_15580 [Capnocytophaga felis]